jgi:hypothetical protein
MDELEYTHVVDSEDLLTSQPLSDIDEWFLRTLKIDSTGYYRYGKAVLQEEDAWVFSTCGDVGDLVEFFERSENYGTRPTVRQYRQLLALIRGRADDDDRRRIKEEIYWTRLNTSPSELVPATVVRNLAADLRRYA